MTDLSIGQMRPLVEAQVKTDHRSERSWGRSLGPRVEDRPGDLAGPAAAAATTTAAVAAAAVVVITAAAGRAPGTAAAAAAAAGRARSIFSLRL
jgi:hypothetical protein